MIRKKQHMALAYQKSQEVKYHYMKYIKLKKQAQDLKMYSMQRYIKEEKKVQYKQILNPKYNNKANIIISKVKELSKKDVAKVIHGIKDFSYTDNMLNSRIQSILSYLSGLNGELLLNYLKAKNRERDHVVLRSVFCWFMYFNTNLTLNTISNTLMRDHSTIYHNLKIFLWAYETNDPDYKIFFTEFIRNGIPVLGCIEEKKEILINFVEKFGKQETYQKMLKCNEDT